MLCQSNRMHNAVQRRCVETYSGIARFSLRQHGILSVYNISTVLHFHVYVCYMLINESVSQSDIKAHIIFQCVVKNDCGCGRVEHCNLV